jgi:hypothetical protein
VVAEVKIEESRIYTIQTCKYVYRSRFPGVVAEVKIEESCIYTLTPDRNPVIDIMPGTNNIVIAAGFSGNKTTLTLSSDLLGIFIYSLCFLLLSFPPFRRDYSILAPRMSKIFMHFASSLQNVA